MSYLSGQKHSFMLWNPQVIATLLFAAGATFCSAKAQSPQTTPAPSATPAASSETSATEVTLDIVARDKHHKPVTNLTTADLSVMDGDSKVTLKNLQRISGKASHDQLVTIIFDRFHGGMAKDAQNIANKLAKSMPAEGYTFAVFDIPGQLRLLQGFTPNRAVLKDAIFTATDSKEVRLESTHTLSVNVSTDRTDPDRDKAADAAQKNLMSIARAGTDLSGAHVDVNVRAEYQSLLNALQESRKAMQEQHSRANLAALMGLVRSQEKISGRKSIVYFTRNMHMDKAAKETVQGITAAATRAGVTISIVDMDAMNAGNEHQIQAAMMGAQGQFDPMPQVVPGSGGMATYTPQQQASGFGFATGIGAATGFQMRSDEYAMFANTVKNPLADLAAGTGGEYIDTTGNLSRPLQALASNLSNYYEVTYDSPVKDFDGAFRPIAIKLQRSDLEVRTKTGYFAVPPGNLDGIQAFEVPLLKALDATTLPADLNFSARVLRFGNVGGMDANTVALDIPISQLTVQKDDRSDLFSAHATAVVQIKDKAGVVVERFGEDFKPRGSGASLEHDPLMSVSMQRHFFAGPGEYTMEVAVSDPVSGKTAARKIPFSISAQGDNGPALSDVTVVRRMETVGDNDADNMDPMRYDKGRVLANASGQLGANSKGVSLFFIVHADAASKDPATLEIQAIHNGTPGRRMPLPLTAKSTGDGVAYLASFGNASLDAGSYEVKAFLTQGGKTVSQSVDFHVAGESNASKGGADAVIAAGPSYVPSEGAPRSVGELTISVPKNPMPPLGDREAQEMLGEARKLALSYTEGLPNFICVEVTNRSVDPRGNGDWRNRDSIVEMMRYRDKQETRTTLEVNGKPADTAHEAMHGALSEGEFGGVLKTVFDPKAHAEFQWKESAEVNGQPVQVFEYKVEKANSKYGVVGTNGREIFPAFRGRVMIDASTHGVRRITLVADDMPVEFTTHYSSLLVDYDYVAINQRDYLLPVAAEMRIVTGKHANSLNTIEFRDYRKFGSQARIVDFHAVDEKQ
jgi:VWFA-related protein